jgi:transcriptional regulator with GAF, ATPase, and Fis domain
VIASTGPPSTSAEPVEAWIKVIGLPAPVVKSVLRELDALDVQLCDRDAPDRPRNGVVAFATMTSGVAEFIHEATNGGSERILALSTSGLLQGDDSWGLLGAGASDVLTWRDPADSARHVAARLRRWRTIDKLLGCQHVRDFLVGESPAWQTVLRDAVEVARFTDAPVLVTGESGTGKERVAQLIHELDPRQKKEKFVVLDCSTVVPSLSGSEFFGHEKGAFTGAAAAREGAFELANGGTLFLDEVGELAVPLQAELLRVIQEGTFKRVGSNIWRKSSFRLVCATNRDVAAELANGTFRNDFYHRIAGCRLHLPPLRDRTDDVLPLFRHFFRQAHPEREHPDIEDGVRELLLRRAYPGNVRELRSLVLRIAHRHLGDGVITVGDIPDQERPDPAKPAPTVQADGFEQSIGRRLAQGATLDDITSAAADVAIRLAVGDEGGSLQRAALRLGVPDSALVGWQHPRQTDGAQRSPA